MKKVILASILVLVVTFIWGCSTSLNNTGKSSPGIPFLKASGKQVINLYFTNADSSKIACEAREVSINSEKHMSEVAILELLKGPVSPDMKRAIPEGTKLLNIKQEGAVVTVNLSKEYNNTESVGGIVARFSVVNTLCDLQNVQKVVIQVEGKELTDTNGKTLGALGKDDVVFETTPTDKDMTNLTLYFANNNGDYLVPEKRKVLVKDKEPLEKYVIQELIKGPKDKGLIKTIPSETKLLSVETNEGVCVVSFSQEFQTKHPGGSTGESMTIYSIVDSLTELPNIRKVQFLIEGQKVESFKGHLVFNEPFKRDSSLIQK